MKNIIKMIKNKRIIKLEDLVTKFILFGTSFVLLLLSQSIYLASINLFKLIPILFACIISLIISTVFLYILSKELHLFPKIPILLIIVLVIISLILIFYPHDNFGGTDNGSYINLAFYLADNGSFNTPLYLNGLPPNIELIKNSLPAYRIWLATQKVLLGTAVTVRGNLLIIILGMLSFFSVSSMIKGKKMGLMSVALLATSMPFLWFSRETMTENLAFFLLWTIIFFFIAFFKSKRFIYFIYLILAMLLFCFTRPEGIFISLFTLFSFIFFIIYKKMLSRKQLLLMITGGLLLIFPFFFIIHKSSYYTNVSSSIINSIKNIISDTNYLFIGRSFLLQRYIFFYTQMLIKYNYFLVILFIFILLFKQLSFSRNRSSTNVYFFALVIIILPEFSKLINPNIQILQPWFYRRYLYALLPLGYLSLSYFLCNLKNKRISFIIFGLFIISNLLLSYPIIFLKHNWTLYTAMNQISNAVTSNDLIIIKDGGILSYYYPQYYLIMQKSIRAIYAFDMKDNDLSLEKKAYKGFPFNKLFYLTDTVNDSYNNYSITNKQIISVNFAQLKPSCELEYIALEYGASDFSLIPYTYALNYCKYPKNEIVAIKKQLYLYQLN